MPGPVYLRGDQLTFRTVESEDEKFIQRYLNAPEFRRWFAKCDPVTCDDVTDFLDTGEGEVHFLPCRNGDPVGFLWWFRIDDIASRGEIGYWIRPEDQGKGYATEAAKLGLRYAFDERGLHKVMARVFEGNTPSRRVLEKLGFEEEARLRDHYYIDGEYVDTYLFRLLADDR